MQLAASAAVLIPYVLLAEPVAAAAFTTRTIVLLLIVGVVHTGVCYALYFSAMDHLRAQSIALASYIDPVVAVLCSAVFLQERMTPLQWIGAVLVIAATMAGELLPEKRTKT